MSSSLYVWESQQPDKSWSTVAVIAVNSGVTNAIPLFTHHLDMAQTMKSMAVMHAASAGVPIRLARYDYAAVLEEVTAVDLNAVAKAAMEEWFKDRPGDPSQN